MASGINPRNGNEEETKNLLNIITEEDHMAKQKPHILMMPYLGQSHANLAKQLASHGVTITFINRQFIHDCLMKMSTGWPQKYCGHTLVLGHDVMPNKG